MFLHSHYGISVGLLLGSVRRHHDMLLVTFDRTKTIQFGSRVLQVPLLAIPDSPICPIQWFDRMVQLTPYSSASDPLFAIVDKGHLLPMSKAWFLARFRDLLGRAGISSPSDFSCPSFRRGGASWAFRAGLPGELIQIYGDWSSDCYKLYIDIAMDSKYMFARNITHSLLV